MSAVVILWLLGALLLSAVTNRDAFSPGKFYLLSFFVFYVGALWSPPSRELWLLLMSVLLVGVIAVLIEAVLEYRSPLGCDAPTANPVRERKFPVWIWLLSIPAIGVQIYLVQAFGGLEGFINIIGNRVVELRGMGWAKTVIATAALFNLIYFALALLRPRSKLYWLGYVAHLLVVLAMGLLSGSRSAILNVFAMQIFIYHYVKRPVRLTHALPVGAVLIAVAIVLGVAREGLKFEGSQLTTGVQDVEQAFRPAIFSYGVRPLELLIAAEELKLAHGSTLLSLTTNAIPRGLWPDKPDTGGIFFTKAYTGDEWDGAPRLAFPGSSRGAAGWR